MLQPVVCSQSEPAYDGTEMKLLVFWMTNKNIWFKATSNGIEWFEESFLANAKTNLEFFKLFS